MRRSTLGAVALTALMALGAPMQARAGDTLADAMVAAYQTSNLLDRQRALLRAADEDVVQAASTLKPVIAFVANGNFQAPAPLSTTENWSANARISASLTLYDNGQTRYATDAAKETVLGLRGALLSIEQDLLLSTVQTYMEVIRAGQSVSLGANNVRLITQELRAARDRFQVGEVTRTDVAIAEARLAAARGNLASAQGDLEIARENYKAVIGRYPGNLHWPKNPPMRVHTEAAAKAFAARKHPDIEQAQRSVNAAEANIRRAKAVIGPTLTGTSALTVTEGFEDTFTAGLQVNVPIYSGGALKSAVRSATANRDAARSALLQAVIDVKRDVGAAWANMSVSAAQTQAAERQVRASQVAFDGVREEAKFGSRTTLDVLNAEQDLLDARSNLITSQVQQYVSLYSLLSALGVLTVEDLKLGIPTYDPLEYYRFATTSDPLHGISKQGRALERVLKSLNK